MKSGFRQSYVTSEGIKMSSSPQLYNGLALYLSAVPGPSDVRTSARWHLCKGQLSPEDVETA